MKHRNKIILLTVISLLILYAARLYFDYQMLLDGNRSALIMVLSYLSILIIFGLILYYKGKLWRRIVSGLLVLSSLLYLEFSRPTRKHALSNYFENSRENYYEIIEICEKNNFKGEINVINKWKPEVNHYQNDKSKSSDVKIISQTNMLESLFEMNIKKIIVEEDKIAFLHNESLVDRYCGLIYYKNGNYSPLENYKDSAYITINDKWVYYADIFPRK